MVNNTQSINRQRPVPITGVNANEYPYSQEAEEAVIGSILIDEQVYYKLATFITPNSFFFPRHIYIWEAFEALVNTQTPIDMLTVAEKLKAMGRLTDCGGDAYLTHLLTSTVSSHNVEAYAKIVQANAARRMLISLAEETKRLALNLDINIIELIANVGTAVDKTASQLVTSDITPMGKHLNRVLDKIEDAMNAPLKMALMPTGIPALDALIGGYQRKKVYVVAGRTHNGKSTLAYASAIACAKAGKSVAIYNTADGDAEGVMMSLLAIESGVSTLDMATGINAQQHLAIIKAAGTLSTLPIYIKSDKNLTPRGLLMHAQAVQFVHGLDIIFVDYVQAMSSDPRHNDYERNKYIAESLDKIAYRLNVAVVEMAQINRAGANGVPNVSHIEGSGKYEQYAAVVIIAYKESLYKPDAPTDRISFLVQKNRVSGRTGTVHARINLQTTALTAWNGG
ncbi:MAG: replicative DNA helicase [Anaerolineae bacterium]|jgi:replicative DNA helicase|nr:replicative DNA helicase [Anaerolineae bacterium]